VSTGSFVGQWDGACFGKGGVPWGVRMDDSRDTVVVADGTNFAVYVLALGGGGTTEPCKLLQTIVTPDCQAHELAVDSATGDVYVACVGTSATVKRLVRDPESSTASP
jgi:hypothetical protein